MKDADFSNEYRLAELFLYRLDGAYIFPNRQSFPREPKQSGNMKEQTNNFENSPTLDLRQESVHCLEPELNAQQQKHVYHEHVRHCVCDVHR